MRAFRDYLAALAGFVVLIAAVTFMTSRSAAAENDKVQSVNILQPLPLPVLAQPGGPAAPFSANVFVTIDPGTTGNLAAINVPAGKRLVVEQVAGRIFLPGGQFVRIVEVRPDFGVASFALVGNIVPGQTDSVTVLNHAMKLYADQQVEFTVSRGPFDTGSGFCAFQVSGYLVDR